MVNFDICKGNPGAVCFMVWAYNTDQIGAEAAFRRMEENQIVGSMLYMLWNDCCDQDTKLALRIAQFASIEDIRTHINYDGGRGFPFTEEELAALPK